MSTLENLTSDNKTISSVPFPSEERILSLTVDIPDGPPEILEVRSTDDIEGIAQNFCERHNLDPECKDMLIKNIRTHLLLDQKQTITQNIQNNEISNTFPKSSITRPVEDLMAELNQWKSKVQQTIEKDKHNPNKPIINSYSRKIVEKMGLQKIPVHERLHQRAVMRQKASARKIEKSQVLKIMPEAVKTVKQEFRPVTSPQKKRSDCNSNMYFYAYYKEK